MSYPLTPNRQAFLAAIRKAEGTSGDDGYTLIVGGRHFTSFADHPRVTVPLKINGRTVNSTAAGAYQFIASSWDEVRRSAGLPDFSPTSQDQAALWTLDRKLNALASIDAGDWHTAIVRSGSEWASFPNNSYGQNAKTEATIRGYIDAALASPTTTPPTLTQARTSIVAVARGQVGTKEQPGNVNRYAPAVGFANGQFWCASFVVWCARQSRIKLAVESPSTEAFYSTAKGDGTWRDLSVVAQPGWLVLFHDRRRTDRNVTHIGIVSADDGRTVTSIEGNTPPELGGGTDGVYEKRHTRSSGYVVGFIRLTNDNLLDGTINDAGDATSGNRTTLLTGSVVPPTWSAPVIADNEAGFAKAYTDLLADLGIEGIEGRAPRIHVDLSMEQTSEVTVSLDDPDLVLLRSGRFVVATESASGTPGDGTTWTWGKSITGQGWQFSLAALEVASGPSGRGGLNLTFRSAAVQRLKQTRAKGGKTWQDRSPSSVVKDWFPRGHYVQDTPVQPQLAITSAAGASSDQARGESEWEAGQRWAEQAGFILFESGGAGFFAQPSWLVSGAGLPLWPLAWKGADTDDGIVSIPSARHTADDFRTPVTVSVRVLATLGMRIHPGSTIALSGLGVFDAVYLVTGSSGDVAPDAVWTITAMTPTNPTPSASGTSTNSTDLYDEDTPLGDEA